MVDFEYKDRYDLNDFRKIMEILRSEEGCPWDREQTHESIRRNVLEEAYELCEAIDQADPEHMCEELGDLQMQIFFHARMEEEKGGFNVDDVADGACKKLILRHPHVFGDTKVADSGEVLRNWDAIKRVEKSQTTTATAMQDVSETLPALWRAEKVQKKAKKVGFDWPDMSGALDKLCEEFVEFQEALDEKNPDHIEEEFGDLLFAAVNAARFAGVDPEKALHRSCVKFINRFRYLEDAARAEGRDLETMTLEEMDALYEEAKKR